MTITPGQLLLSISIGVPLLLLALGVLYHAYVLGRQPAGMDDLDAHVEALATESADVLLLDLQEAVERMQGQLARQRESLAGLLSDEGGRPRTPAMATAMAPAMAMSPPMPAPPVPAFRPAAAAEPEMPMAAGAYVERSRPAVTPRRAVEDSRRAPAPNPLGIVVAQLASEGLSDRAIARRLHIGLEEVRMARMRVGR